MVLKADQERVKTLIRDTVTLLCKNGLEFRNKFSLEALIGVTLDEGEVVLLSINELVQADGYAQRSPAETSPAHTSPRKRRKRSRSGGQIKAEVSESDGGEELVFVKEELVADQTWPEVSADYADPVVEASSAAGIPGTSFSTAMVDMNLLESNQQQTEWVSQGSDGSYGNTATTTVTMASAGQQGTMATTGSQDDMTGQLSGDPLDQQQQPILTYLRSSVSHRNDADTSTTESGQGSTDNDPSPSSSEEAPKEATKTSSRFAEIDESKLTDLIDSQKNINTQRKTRFHINILKEFLQTRGEDREPETIPPVDLNNHLSLFFVSLKKSDAAGKDDDYEPSSLKSFQSSIERYLREHYYSVSIIHHPDFTKSRQAIASKCKLLKQKGKGNKPNAKRAPTDFELNQMWEQEGLGPNSPESLQHTVWWIICTQFGFSGNKDNYLLRWGDVTMETDAISGRRFLMMNERDIKTRQGTLTPDTRDLVTVFESDGTGLYCPVKIFEKYQTKRPAEMCEKGAPFYLQPKMFSTNSNEDTPVWFKNQVHGINSIKTYMKRILEKAGLQSDDGLSNVSARKYLASTTATTVQPETAIQVYEPHQLEVVNIYPNTTEQDIDSVTGVS